MKKRKLEEKTCFAFSGHFTKNVAHVNLSFVYVAEISASWPECAWPGPGRAGTGRRTGLKALPPSPPKSVKHEICLVRRR